MANKFYFLFSTILFSVITPCFSITNENTTNTLVGPSVDNKPLLDGVKWESKYLLRTVKGRNFKTTHEPSETFGVKLHNVNTNALKRMTNNLNAGKNLLNIGRLNYGVYNGCVNQSARSLLFLGVITANAFLPITAPLLLNAELFLRNYAMMNSYQFLNFK
jgi:uncharacterized membrane protein